MEPRERIVAALTAEDGALRRAGIELVLDHVLAQPVAAFVELDAATEILVQALARDNAVRAIERHVLPGVARVRAALSARQERVGDSLPEEAKHAIEALVTNPRGPRFGWLRGALERDKLRVLVAPALQEVFLSFTGRITQAGRDSAAFGATAAAAQLLGRFGRDTGERLRHLGKSVADGLGVDIERKLRDAARDYSQAAVAVLEGAVRTRLATGEGQALVAALSRGVLDHVLATPMTVILDDLDRLPLADAIRVAPAVLEHDLARELWRGIVREEVRAVLALEGQRSLRELLDEAGLLAAARAQLLLRADPALRELFGSHAFAGWIDALLGATAPAPGAR